MDRISELKRILGENLTWNKARLDCFTRMLIALFVVRPVNLSEIAVAFSSKADVDSRYKRLQRFFGKFKIDYTIIARFIYKLFFSESQKVYLTIDRTNWYWGKQKINIFMLGVAYEGIAIYLRRWEVECLFSALNGRGFRFEETHMTSLEKVEKLTAVLAIGFCWAHKVGEWKAVAKKAIRIKKHRDSNRPQNSFFRYGFDFIRDLLINSCEKLNQFKKYYPYLLTFTYNRS